MTETRFWLIRHAIVEENARALIYGANDVPICPRHLIAQRPMYEALARRLPPPGPNTIWLASPLSRTQRTAAAIMDAGYPEQPPVITPELIELSFGDWQGLRHHELPAQLREVPHPFWPISGTERPPGGESMQDGLDRVGPALEMLADRYAGKDVIAVSHGGTIRAAVAHALRIDASQALHLSVDNLSLTKLDRNSGGWLVGCVNELPGV